MDVDLGQLGQPLASGNENMTDADEIHIGFGVTEDLEDVLCNYQNPVFICDSNTRAAAELFLEEEFKDCLVIELSPEGLAVNDDSMVRVLTQLEVCDRGQSSVEVDLLIAIGSSVIHDLTRVAAREYGTPYVLVPTRKQDVPDEENAASSFISDFKPQWVFADAQILCPEHANRSERMEMITEALLACGLEEKDFWEKMTESETL